MGLYLVWGIYISRPGEGMVLGERRLFWDDHGFYNYNYSLSILLFLPTSPSKKGIAINVFICLVIAFNFFSEYKNQLGYPKKEWAHEGDICLFSSPISSGNVGYGSSVLMAIAVQPCMMPMYEELENRSVARFAKAQQIASGFVFLLFTAVCCLAYFTYGDDLQGNMLLNLPQDTW